MLLIKSHRCGAIAGKEYVVASALQNSLYESAYDGVIVNHQESFCVPWINQRDLYAESLGQTASPICSKLLNRRSIWVKRCSARQVTLREVHAIRTRDGPRLP
jgi:hypothetical protein